MKKSTRAWILFIGAFTLFALAYQLEQIPLLIFGIGWLIASIIIGIDTVSD